MTYLMKLNNNEYALTGARLHYVDEGERLEAAATGLSAPLSEFDVFSFNTITLTLSKCIRML